MTTDERTPGTGDDLLAREIAIEQAHVDRVYAELVKAGRRAELVAVEGLSRGRTDRTGDVRDEEITGLFERDALMFNASRRRHALDRQYEGLVFGRLDLDHADGSTGEDREARYIGRLGVRDDEYEPLVIDWRAPAAAPFYRATPVEPLGVLRRRVLRCLGERVVGLEDDLMVAEAPDDLVVLGEGALLAALGRSRSGRMRDIVATIQAHQDEAIRAPARGVTFITGGPGTGKTVVALHRAAYLLYSDRRRFEGGGILVVGPSAAYTAYIERVLPSLGEDSVTLRSVGDVVESITTARLDPPDVARLKGSLAIRRVLARASRDAIPGAPTQLRTFIAGRPIHLTSRDLDRVRSQVLRRQQRNASGPALEQALAEAAWRQVHEGEKADFLEAFAASREVESFLRTWGRGVDPREVLLWLGDPERARSYCAGVFEPAQADALSASVRAAVSASSWSVADAALVDDLAARLGPIRVEKEERGFYEVDELDDALGEVSELGHATSARTGRRLGQTSHGTPTGMDALLRTPMEPPSEYAHVLVDEAQDLSPMQWRMIGRRGRWASWTVVGDAAQASWPDAAEADAARDEAFGSLPRRSFHMSTNYRNAREIFEHAARVITAVMPDADIPDAVRESGVDPIDEVVGAARLVEETRAAVETLRSEVEGAIAVVAPAAWRSALADLDEGETRPDARVSVVDPLSTKGLEYDATVVVDPDEIVAESPGGARVLYVVLTRAAHRMIVLRP
ncbi:HelD family protein [Agilicoccus flavus]|uniref:HelD family protein n=1 Tax=Agilicoccus flavus TaxID=2775968 RepID=UPI001CF662D6|nr:AAA family ATPase [Agilicoccus flavus]